ncbi:MAG TPA: class I SAM-dependent methyltransferase [Candidatus Limnocylindria bacterium]|nr:class I SAM-dependent methyltransferase [Candidatus Limnocylindria bacterium]
MGPRPLDNWANADRYHAYVGRWSALVAREFLGWLGAPNGGRWLDVGCGPGTLVEAVLERCAPRDVVGVDPSEGFLAAARGRVSDRRASFVVGTAERLPPDLEKFDGVVSGLVLNFVPDTAAAVAEMTRVTRPDGVVGAYVWDYADGMQLMRYFWDAAAELDPAAAAFDEGRRFPRFGSERLPALMGAHLSDVVSTGIVVETPFADFDDYWRPFLGGQGPAPSYAMSLDEKARHRLRDVLLARLPTAPDGTIALTARAWAVKGTRPA